MRKEIKGKFESLEQHSIILNGEQVQVYQVQKTQNAPNSKQKKGDPSVVTLTAFSEEVF